IASGQAFDNGGVRLSAGLAHRLEAVADPLVAHVMDQGGHQTGSAGAERVPESDGTADRVKERLVGPGLCEPSEGHGSEGLIHLEGADVSESEVRAPE